MLSLSPYNASTRVQLVKNLVSTQYFLYTTVNNLEHIFCSEFRLQIIFSFESRVEVFRFSDTLYAEVNTTEGKRLSFQPLYRHHKFLGVITIIMSIPPLWFYICVCVCVCVCVEKAMAPHSSTVAWKIPWMEEPGRLQSMGSHRVGHD